MSAQKNINFRARFLTTLRLGDR